MMARKAKKVTQKINKQRFIEKIGESDHDNKVKGKEYNAMKVVYFLLLLSLPAMFVCASILIILKHIKINDKFSLNALEIFLYSLISVSVMSFIALMLFIVVKYVDRFHKNRNVSKNGDDKVLQNVLKETKEAPKQKTDDKDSEGLVVDSETKVVSQKTGEDSQQEVLEQKRQMIKNEAFKAIISGNVVNSTDDSIDIRKDLIKAICSGIRALHVFCRKYPHFVDSDNYTTILMTPFKGVIPLDLAITLGKCKVVKFLMRYAYFNVISRDNDEGQQVVALSKESGDPEMQKIVEHYCKLYRMYEEKFEQKRLKYLPNAEEKPISETDNHSQSVNLDEVRSVSSKSENLSLNS